jgi:hypothetical protein
MSMNMQSENSLRLLWGRFDMSPFMNTLNPSALVVNSLSELKSLVTAGIDQKEIVIILRKGQETTRDQKKEIAILLGQNKLVRIFKAEIVYSKSESDLKTILDLVSNDSLIFVICNYYIPEVIKTNFNSQSRMLFLLDEAV